MVGRIEIALENKQEFAETVRRKIFEVYRSCFWRNFSKKNSTKANGTGNLRSFIDKVYKMLSFDQANIGKGAE